MPTINDEPSDESPTPDAPIPPHHRTYRHVEHRETFGPQPTPTSELPPPGPWVAVLVGGVMECLQGLREPQQFARWMSEDVYRTIVKHSNKLVTQLSSVSGTTKRIQFTVGSVVLSSPRDGVVEAAVVVKCDPRIHAVALRLEGLDRRWRATHFHLF